MKKIKLSDEQGNEIEVKVENRNQQSVLLTIANQSDLDAEVIHNDGEEWDGEY